MLLEDLAQRPIEAQQYLERYVNDGSPSGFSELNKTSPETDALGLAPWFNLFLLRGPDAWFRTSGEIPQWPAAPQCGDSSWLLLHPDMADHPSLRIPELRLDRIDAHKVVPTASGRTVQFIHRSTPDYVKLHYDGVLGRVHRGLPYQKAVAGPEISRLIVDALANNRLDAKLALLPETGARVLTVAGAPKQEWGMVWRSHRPLGPMVAQIRYMCPYFALFSKDRLRSFDPPLLTQLIQGCRGSPSDFVLEELLIPVVRCYFSLVTTLGLQPEWNAQNLLVGLASDFSISSIIMRDLGRSEKDLTLREQLGLNNTFESFPYKCIACKDELYVIRHSFSFDFKLGEYVIEPVVGLLCYEYGTDPQSVRGPIREVAESHIKQLPPDHFPKDGCWYGHDRILLTDKRPYVAIPNPKYRS